MTVTPIRPGLTPAQQSEYQNDLEGATPQEMELACLLHLIGTGRHDMTPAPLYIRQARALGLSASWRGRASDLLREIGSARS